MKNFMVCAVRHESGNWDKIIFAVAVNRQQYSDYETLM